MVGAGGSHVEDGANIATSPLANNPVESFLHTGASQRSDGTTNAGDNGTLNLLAQGYRTARD